MPTCRATKLCRTISSRRCGQQSSTPRCPGPMFYKSSACWPAGFEESKRGHLGEGTRATIPHLSNSEQYELLSGNRGIIKKILQSLGKVPISSCIASSRTWQICRASSCSSALAKTCSLLTLARGRRASTGQVVATSCHELFGSYKDSVSAAKIVVFVVFVFQ